MKAVQQQTPKIFWAKVKNGILQVWDGKHIHEFKTLSGKIVGIYFKDEEYNGTKYELALFHVIYMDERWIMSVRVDSQYFRSLCNYLHTCKDMGIHNDELIFCPSYSEREGKKWTSIYIQQKNERWVKSYKHELELPYIPKITEAGNRKIYDWTNLNNYYKNWLLSQYGHGWDRIVNVIPDVEIIPPPDDPDDLPF